MPRRHCGACGDLYRPADLPMVRVLWRGILRWFCNRCAGDYMNRGLIPRHPPMEDR